MSEVRCSWVESIEVKDEMILNFHIDCGSMPPQKALDYIEKIKVDIVAGINEKFPDKKILPLFFPVNHD